MYKSVSFEDFQDAFRNMDREENFSYEALRALFDYLERLEEDMGEPMKLDVVAFCCVYEEIHDDEEAYFDYVGDNATREEDLIAILDSSILVREG